MRLLLASTSPQRRALLALLKLSFDVVEPRWIENHDLHGSPRDLSRYHAEQKARSTASQFPYALVLSGDTVIEVDGQALGKPRHVEEAREMLARLGGRSHQVHTSVALIHYARQIEVVFTDTATVWMNPLTNEAIDSYLATGESLECAGSYSIQGIGVMLISHIEGDYTTVVGFPLRRVVEALEDAGIEPPIELNTLYRDRPYPNWDRF